MKELLDTLDAWPRDGVGVGRAVVVRTFGSAPRPEGAVLLRADDGRIAGSVSGGCVEGAAAEEIERARRDGHSRVIRYGISDEEAWDVGLACGGTIDVLIEPARSGDATVRRARPELGASSTILLPADAPPPEFGRSEPGDGELPPDAGRRPRRRHRRGFAGLAVGRRRASRPRPATRSSAARREPSRSRAARSSSRRSRSSPGSSSSARSRSRGRSSGFARELGYETIVIDGRASFATPERFPPDRSTGSIVGWPDEVADEIGLGPDDAVAVLTHDVKFDEPAIVEALRRGCRYVGAVGSRKTQGDRRERLRAAGVSEDELARLRGPVGLDLGGRAPAETALAIMAEVVAERYGGSGRPMVETAKGLGTPGAAASAASAPVGAAAG